MVEWVNLVSFHKVIGIHIEDGVSLDLKKENFKFMNPCISFLLLPSQIKRMTIESHSRKITFLTILYDCFVNYMCV